LQFVCSPGPARIASHLQKGMLAWLQIIFFATNPPTWPGLQTFCDKPTAWPGCKKTVKNPVAYLFFLTRKNRARLARVKSFLFFFILFYSRLGTELVRTLSKKKLVSAFGSAILRAWKTTKHMTVTRSRWLV
jgi:hypothetical protein